MSNYGHLGASPSTLNGHGSQHHNNHQIIGEPARNRRAPRSCCGLSSQFIVYVLFIFNFIFLTSGVVMLVVTLFYRAGSFVPLGDDMQLATIRGVLPFKHPLNIVHYSMIACAGLICIISLIMLSASCCLPAKKARHAEAKSNLHQLEDMDMEITSTSEDFEGLSFSPDNVRRVSLDDPARATASSCFLCFFIFALLFLFTIQVTISLVGFVSIDDNSTSTSSLTLLHESTTSPPVTHPLLIAIREKFDSQSDAQILEQTRDAFDVIEPRFKCCGLTAYSDYPKDVVVPTSCCKTPSDDCGRRRHPSNIYYDGCVDRLSGVIREQIILLASLALGLSLVEVFGLLFSCCLYVQMLSSER